MTANLILHKGARLVSLDEVAAVPTPDPTATWAPVAHKAVLETVEDTLAATDFAIRNRRLALSHNGNQFFATLDLFAPLATGVSLSIGVRNSIDRSLSMGFLAGNRVWICDNLAFSADLMVHRKHSLFGATRFREAIALAAGRLEAFRATESLQIERLHSTEVDDREAESLVMRAWEARIVNHRLVPEVLREWRTPSHDEFSPRTRWSLFNAFTESLKPFSVSNPAGLAARTFALNRLLVPPQEGPTTIAEILESTQVDIDALIADDGS